MKMADIKSSLSSTSVSLKTVSYITIPRISGKVMRLRKDINFQAVSSPDLQRECIQKGVFASQSIKQ